MITIGKPFRSFRTRRAKRRKLLPHDTTRTIRFPEPIHVKTTTLSRKLDFVKQMLKPKINTYRFANPRWHKLAFDPLPGGNLGGSAPQPRVFPSEVILRYHI